jgi:alpha-beta hydrolase superfamily lysophospholipase
MRRIHYLVLGGVAAAAFLGSAIVGTMLGGGMLHPMVRPLSPVLIQRADRALQQTGATREDFVVGAPDGVMLSGWKARPRQPNGAWVLVFHGMSDNRAGPLGQAQLLLRHGYSLLMMDARAHGESGGSMATFGWMERRDTQAITDALYATETPGILVALGTSMGAAIALQSAGMEPRIAGVVAESAFRNLREVTYDYAGLKWMPWLGMTLFRPATWTALAIAEPEGGFAAEEVSPEKAVAARAFPVLLICDALDGTIPCRHSRSIFEAATGPKQLWEVPGARHARALGTAPAEYERRVISFLEGLRRTSPGGSSTAR